VLEVKLRYIDRWNERSRQIAAAYDDALRPLGLRRMEPIPGSIPVHHVYALEVGNRDDTAAALADAAVASGIHYAVPVHRQPAFASTAALCLPVAERLGDVFLSLPMSPGLDQADVDQVLTVVTRVARPAA
jgi:dTDP-4-amino-4,6-dideoxygalactose transaminase